MIDQNEMNEISEIFQISGLVTNNNVAEANLAEGNFAENNFAFLAGGERGIKAAPECPECRMKMIRLGVCFSCPECGYGSCG